MIKYQSINQQKAPFDIFNATNNKKFVLRDLQGVGLAATNNITTTAGYDGGAYISTALPVRSISLTFDISANSDVSVEIARIYNTFTANEQGTLYYVTDTETKKIGTYINAVTVNHLSKPVSVTIGFECPQPFWETEERTEYMATTLGTFVFPFSIEKFELLQSPYFDTLAGWQISNNNFTHDNNCILLKANMGVLLWQDIQPVNMTVNDTLKIEINAECRKNLNFAVSTVTYSDTAEVVTAVYEATLSEANASVSVTITADMLSATYLRFSLGSSSIAVDCTIYGLSVHIGGNLEFGQLNNTLLSHLENNGEKETGAIFTITAMGSVTNPKITDTDTLKKMEVTTTLNAGDKLIISTIQGAKTITKVSNGVKSNMFNAKSIDFDFLQLHQGMTNLLYDATSNAGNMAISVEYTEKYGGV